MHFKGIVFDMDGLMFDTERLAIEGWLHAGRQSGWPITRELIIGTIGFNTERTRSYYAEQLGPNFDYDQVSRMARERVQSLIEADGLPMKPGLQELLIYFKGRDCKIALATSTRIGRARQNLERAGIIRYFDALVGGDMVARSKPEPDIYLEACRRLGLPPGDCLAFEDSPAGIRSATSAGMSAIMVPDIIRPDAGIRALILAELNQLDEAIDLLEAT